MASQIDYLLHLADNALVLGQRNAGWCGHGPAIEEDIALANVSLDLIGQARMLYQRVAQLKGGECTEDALAYFRDAAEFRNYTLLELPHHAPLAANAAADRDYATTIVCNFLYSALMALLWEALQKSSDPQLAAIAAKSLKEVRYHLRYSRDWLLRLGDGTEESHNRAQAALDHLMPYTQEFWISSVAESEASAAGIGVDLSKLRVNWDTIVDHALQEATLTRSKAEGYVSQGKNGLHSEHLAYLLGELQGLARAHPQGCW